MAKKNLALKIAIIESGRSQIDIAEAAELHDSYLSMLVNGRRQPSTAVQKTLARILKRKPAELFPEAAVAS